MDELLAAKARDVAMQIATVSPCKKRKVGAVVVDNNGMLFAGYNAPDDSAECEDSDGNTLPTVTHAEVVAIREWHRHSVVPAHTIFVTHQPCDNCKAAIAEAGIKEIIIVDKFMKFDTDKPTFELLPGSITLMCDSLTSLSNLVIKLRSLNKLNGLAYDNLVNLLAGGRSASIVAKAINRVLQYGAKKYKPNNWRNVDNINRYWDALMRHCIAIEQGEDLDSESGLPHRDHALCNIAFLTELIE
jgi:deoxycytidylate deaminase